MKSIARTILVRILGWQVKRLQAKSNPFVIAVVGSIGKTSTKYAIAQTLEGSKQVRWQKGNYNHVLTVPLVFFGQSMPSLLNPFGWLRVIIKNEAELLNYKYDVVVLEIGTDAPGQILEFAQYLTVNLAVITAITPEHMEFFKDLDAVAKEELSIASYSDRLIINKDLVPKKYFTRVKKSVSTYGSKGADVTLANGSHLTLSRFGKPWIKLDKSASTAQAYSITAAAIVAQEVGCTDQEIISSLGTHTPVPGRMQILQGINNSIIIDDTYNASPDATIAALHTLYQRGGSHKIALLGNMNELGVYSKDAHKTIGSYCDPKKLDWVVTVGPDANAYLAPAAEAKGCKVKTFENPYDAGKFVKDHLESKSVVLAKGSQNNVYMEEAIKELLADADDSKKLVRQSAAWHKKKRKNFQK